jgi:hypothetical protein
MLKCGKLSFIEVINEDGEKVTTKTAHKQLRYMPLMPQMNRLFISKKTTRHMRWHKEGVCENDQVIVHTSDSEACKALDDFDPDFVRDARNVRIGIPWLKNRIPVYLEFCKLSSSPEFNAKSEKKRLNCGNDPKHRYGADGHIRKGQRMVRLRVQVLYTFLFSFD